METPQTRTFLSTAVDPFKYPTILGPSQEISWRASRAAARSYNEPMNGEPAALLDNDLAELRREVAATLTAFEETTGRLVCIRTLSNCWHDDAGRLVLPVQFHIHRSPFCVAVKDRDRQACLKCDFYDLSRICRPAPDDAPFIRTCHAGADEVLLPIWNEGLLVAVLFIGQFLRETTPEPAPLPGAGTGAGAGLPGAGQLPRVDDRSAERLLALALPLRTYLLDVLARINQHRRERSVDRRGIIETYIRENLTPAPTLGELARRLSLSPSRASHVVRQLTGQSFQQLVEARRLATAQDLLVHTGAKIGHIAEQTGFRDVAYFCRYFRSKTGLTPRAFRKQHQRLGTVEGGTPQALAAAGIEC